MRLIAIGVAAAAALALGTAAATDAAPPAPGRTDAGAPSSATPPSVSPPHALPSTSSIRHRPAVVEHYVDLNSASRKELMTLPGIGKAEADRIVANRPYLVKTDLVSKNVLPLGPFLSLKHLVVAMPKSTTQAKR